MSLAPPERGSVIRYAYLWADENERGREEGEKDRRALVLSLAISKADGQTALLVLAVTHTPRVDPDDAVPFPPEIKRRIGLDLPSWIVTTEANALPGRIQISDPFQAVHRQRLCMGGFPTVCCDRLPDPFWRIETGSGAVACGAASSYIPSAPRQLYAVQPL